MKEENTNGKVYFIGAGPGDPELLTIKATRILSEADVILHDRLVSPKILEHASSASSIILTGKQKGGNSISQKEINELILKFALQGKTVVRLKGGDVSFFSNILDELETVSNSNIPFEIVPGITAASGAAAYTGIPLTARGYADAVRFLTLNDLTAVSEFTFRKNETLVLYMSSSNWSEVICKLIHFGIDTTLPIAFISQATTPNQQQFFSTISAVQKDFENNTFISPTIIIIGRVVELGEKFEWFKKKEKGVYFTAL